MPTPKKGPRFGRDPAHLEAGGPFGVLDGCTLAAEAHGDAFGADGGDVGYAEEGEDGGEIGFLVVKGGVRVAGGIEVAAGRGDEDALAGGEALNTG